MVTMPMRIAWLVVMGLILSWGRGLVVRTTWTFHSAGQLLFGAGATRQLGEVVARLGARRVLLVTDPVLRRAGLLDQVKEPLAGLSVEAFTEGEPEPSLRAAQACIGLARQFRPDAVLGL